MSSIYIQEPSTLGKVLLKTSVGDIDIELWARECPKACRNFIQLCLEGYYNGTIFHRIVSGFIAQGGDPNGDGTGGESIYGEPFKDEFHSRLRFSRRGLVAMANSDKDDNGSQFFFTLGATPELQNKHTLFGKVTGDTVFNMLKLEDCLVDHNEKPLYPPKIVKAEVLNNPFDDIVPREHKRVEKKEKAKKREKGVKNFGLLSFGEEAEEDEEETKNFVQKIAGKAKSTHDVLDDPLLSKETLQISKSDRHTPEVEDDQKTEEDEENIRDRTERVKNKLRSVKNIKEKNNVKEKQNASDSDEDFLTTMEKEKKIKRDKKAQEIREEILTLKKQYQDEKKVKNELIDKTIEKEAEKETKNELVKEYITEKEKYNHLKDNVPKKGATREEFTLSLLSKFRNKLEILKEKSKEGEPPEKPTEDKVEKEIQSDDWLSHQLCFQDAAAPTLAKDASTKSDDWYDVYDPRNPLNKRKRGEQRDREREQESGSKRRR